MADVYILPREKRMKRPDSVASARHGIGLGPVRAGGPGLLLAGVVTQAIIDYYDAPPVDSDDSRWYLANEGGRYGQHLAALGVAWEGDGCPPLPADMEPFVIRLDEVTDERD